MFDLSTPEYNLKHKPLLDSVIEKPILFDSHNFRIVSYKSLPSGIWVSIVSAVIIGSSDNSNIKFGIVLSGFKGIIMFSSISFFNSVLETTS